MKDGKIWKIPLLMIPIIVYLFFVVSLKPDLSIEALIDPKTRLRTYHVMWSRTESANKYDFYTPLLRFKNFEGITDEVRLMEIPQKDAPNSPLYLILHNQQFSSSFPQPPWSSWKIAKDTSNWNAWFTKSPHPIAAPLVEKPTSQPFTSRYIVSLHSADGALLDETEPWPFGGPSLTQIGETIYDINQDGWVERVTSSNLGFSDRKSGGTLMTIEKINAETKLLFSTLINVTSLQSDPSITDTWSYQCIDTNSDGNLELQIGPENGPEIEAKVTFFWNSKTETFESPSGTVGPHFLVIPVKDDWGELWKVLEDWNKAGKLRYPLDQ